MNADEMEKCRQIDEDWQKMLRNDSVALQAWEVARRDQAFGPLERIKFIALVLSDARQKAEESLIRQKQRCACRHPLE